MGYLESLMAENEKVVFVTRRHWTTLVPGIVLHALLAVAICALAWFVTNTEGRLGLLILVLLLYPGVWILLRLLRWTNEMYLVTNRRVMEVRGIFAKYAADSALEKVNDVALYQSLMGRLYNYGDVEIVTGSDIGVNRFSRISRPVKFKTEMLNQKAHLSVHTEEEENGMAPHIMPVGANAAKLLEDLGRLRTAGVLSEEEFQAKKRNLLAKM